MSTRATGLVDGSVLSVVDSVIELLPSVALNTEAVD